MRLLKHPFPDDALLMRPARHLARVLQLFVPITRTFEPIDRGGAGVPVRELRTHEVWVGGFGGGRFDEPRVGGRVLGHGDGRDWFPCGGGGGYALEGSKGVCECGREGVEQVDEAVRVDVLG